MKRAATPTAISAPLNKLPRQTPVSCKNCRAKKLKCDRNAPCSNCASRGIQCDYAQLGLATAISHPVERQDDPVLRGSLGARLDRLEQLLLSIAEQKPGQLPQLQILRHPANNSKDIRRSSTSQDSSSSSENSSKRHSEEQDMEHSLEQAAHTILTSFDSFGAFSSAKDFLKVRVLSMKSMLAVATIPSLGIEAFLPTYTEACVLLEDYICHVEHMQRLVHIPNSRFHLQNMYEDLTAGTPVSPARVALFLGIFANSAARASLAVGTQQIVTLEEARDFALLWHRVALDILDKLIRIRTVTLSLEQLQATLVLSHPTNCLEGLSIGFRHLINIALNMAREMGIHRLDTSANIKARRHASPEELVEVELRRRLWWHIVATDWLAASIVGPQEHVYNVQPAHFQVNMPLNADDEQLPLLVSTPNINPPALLPSQMSYELARIELGTICREIVDALPHDDISIEHLTSRLRNLVESLPPYFRLDEVSKSLCRAVHVQRPYLRHQGVLLMAGTHYRITELHRARLIRSRHSTKPEARRRYAASRAICLESSRAVIKCGQGPPEVWALGAFVHHYFMAILALAFDLHHSPQPELDSVAGPDQQQASRVEIQQACDILVHMQRVSTTVQRLVKPLTDVLKRASDRALGPTSGAKTTRDYESTSPSIHTAKWEENSGIGDLGSTDITEHFDPFTEILDTAALGFDEESLSTFFRDLEPGFAPF